MSTATQIDLFGGGALELPQPIPVAQGKSPRRDRDGLRQLESAIDASGIDRPDLAARITALTGKRLPLSVLNAQTAMSRPDHVPNLLQAMAFDAATGEWALLAMYAEAAGGRVIFGDDLVALELGRAAMIKRQAIQRETFLKKVAGIGR